MKSDLSDTSLHGAGLSLWERIKTDPKFLKTKREIQARYGLPLPYDIRLENKNWLAWIGMGEKPTNPRAKRGRAFLKEVRALFKKFEVPDAWQYDFIADIAGLSSGNTFEEWSTPKFNLNRDAADGNWKWECIITPETDLTNPLILHFIQRGQKEFAGNPPRPAKAKNDPRKLDWRPVYEWYKRHPLFTIEEIAKKINYAPQVVRRKFIELDNEK
jgi:hypothetical protein